jgi:hypothetical protein
VALAAPNAWFTYYFWLDDQMAPDWARTIDIHRKPGYDPVELFLDPRLRPVKLAVGWRLAKRALGLRTLLDVIPLDAGLVRGSHGRHAAADDLGAVFITSDRDLLPDGPIAPTKVKSLMLAHIFARAAAAREPLP